jgi:peptide deformylase
MISEIDIKDWQHINIDKAKKNLENLNYAAYCISFEEDYQNLKLFIESVELLRKKQVKQIPALFKGD